MIIISKWRAFIEDTLLGFRLEPYHTSIRKRQRQNPKFFWFEGVVRALQKVLGSLVQPSTSYYGELFEAFLITQIRAGLEYQVGQYQLSYLLTKDDAEIDLIVERPGMETLCIEIKSGQQVRKEELRNLSTLSADIPNSRSICLYNGDTIRDLDGVELLPWKERMKRYHLVPSEAS